MFHQLHWRVKNRLHNAVVATLTKRINGKGFTAESGKRLLHQTVRKQTDIELRKHSDVSKSIYVDVTIVQQVSDLKLAPRVKLAISDNIDCCNISAGG